MKFSCDVSVGNRSLPELSIKSVKKHVRSTLAICQQPKEKGHCIIWFTSQNKSGTKYELKENILNIFGKFISAGKLTIQFKQPPHDLYIKGDAILVKSFAHTLRCVLQNGTSANLPIRTVAAASMSTVKIAQQRMVIQEKTPFPSKGFPRTLEVLHINYKNMHSLNNGILKLHKLRVLDLSHNNIEMLPAEFANLPNLISLNLSHNNFGNGRPDQWSWIDGKLLKSLESLNLSYNALKFLPDNLVKLIRLEHLNVSQNRLSSLPSGIGNLSKLKNVNVSHNALTILPGSVMKWKLLTFDVSFNNFISAPAIVASPPVKVLPIRSLKECAATIVLANNLRYTPETLPVTLIRYLNLARYCVCGSACFNVYVKHSRSIVLSSIAKDWTLSATESNIFLPLDCYYCSFNCLNSHRTRERVPVIR